MGPRLNWSSVSTWNDIYKGTLSTIYCDTLFPVFKYEQIQATYSIFIETISIKFSYQ